MKYVYTLAIRNKEASGYVEAKYATLAAIRVAKRHGVQNPVLMNTGGCGCFAWALGSREGATGPITWLGAIFLREA